MDKYSYLSNVPSAVVEQLYEQYRRDPNSVDFGWRKFFEGYEFAQGGAEPADQCSLGLQKEIYVLNLINDYRMRGHLFTRTNPVRERRQYRPPLDLETYHLCAADVDTVFQAGTEIGLGPTTLRTIVDHLRRTYCQSIGVEYKYISDPVAVEWLRERMERECNTPHYAIEQKRQILRKLSQAVLFEQFLHTRFVGQKRFSLEGAETFIPALEAIIERGSALGIEEFVFGMAHRGRLNVLANILGKTYADIFSEFEGRGFEDHNSIFDGDVKYHLGFSSDRTLANGQKVHLSLSPNPSHLEAVGPVVEGIVRAKLERRYHGDENRIVPILIHGDASIAGQGVVYEVTQMSLLRGYRTGGTIHVVTNNQVGFTTNYLDGRSSTYCTDVAKVTRSPVFHVNADDVEAVVYAVQLAVDFRQRFHRDVFIDLLGYRKHGHNEGDEPRFTQPRLYQLIAQHPNPREIYLKKLIAEGSITADEAEQMKVAFQDELQRRLDEAKARPFAKVTSFLEGNWQGIKLDSERDWEQSPATGVSAEVLRPLAQRMLALPENLKCFGKIRKLFVDRQAMLADGTRLDWAVGEWLAYASLLHEGTRVRISGQDCERGTFAHRHAVITIEDGSEAYVPLNHLGPEQARFEIYNSLLSEYGVLGFEFGYAMSTPHGLTIWEAQFGDFTNGAQIIVDQFLCCAETKWQRMNGLVLFLPHGSEGQGPEHSSARLERFLTLCAGKNMQVVNCTTPANFFHVLRRQIHRPFRKPLVLMTPKSLLRHPGCVSPLTEFTQGRFCEVIDDATVDPRAVRRVLGCSGKIYYELLEQRATLGRGEIALVRVEQLYPFPKKQLQALRDRYTHAREWCWVQEEPENMGAWTFMARRWDGDPLRVVARKASATPASGFQQRWAESQAALVAAAFREPGEK